MTATDLACRCPGVGPRAGQCGNELRCTHALCSTCRTVKERATRHPRRPEPLDGLSPWASDVVVTIDESIRPAGEGICAHCGEVFQGFREGWLCVEGLRERALKRLEGKNR
jgi:hypothetical protein